MSGNELEWKIDYALGHPQHRRDISQHGQYTVLGAHTYRHRIEQVIEETFSVDEFSYDGRDYPGPVTTTVTPSGDFL